MLAFPPIPPINVVMVSVRLKPPASPAVRADNKRAARTGNLNKHNMVKTKTDITIGLKSTIMLPPLIH